MLLGPRPEGVVDGQRTSWGHRRAQTWAPVMDTLGEQWSASPYLVFRRIYIDSLYNSERQGG